MATTTHDHAPTPNDPPATSTPTGPGLHDPAFEHDSCGIGFVAHLKGEKSRDVVRDALTILRRLSHRAAVGADPLTGDGAGIHLQLPHRFFKREGLALGFDLPRRRGYAVGQVFLPRDPAARAACERIVEDTVVAEGQRVLGWRDVPVDDGCVGVVARRSLPVVRQIYVARRRIVPSAFERTLFVVRKLAEHRVAAAGVGAGVFHIASLSAETIVYKGLLLPGNLPVFYRDLEDELMVSAIAIVHSRFSTNTAPTWDLAQPFRMIAHNGEINTVRGNRAWINARRRLLQSAKFPGGLDRLWPILDEGKSDSCQFDNMLELLVLGGRSLPHAMMMMIPEAWEHDDAMDADRRAFYEYAGALLEPWDGPAAIAFTDGALVGATLDRNGLRPARYVVTHDDRVILASEAGVLDVPTALVKKRGRLQPGRMFLVDTTEGRVLEDDEVKRDITARFPYRRWLDKNAFSFDELTEAPAPPRTTDDELRTLQRAFGTTEEDLHNVLKPMAETAKEPVGSMGNDAPLAALSLRAPSLFDYFHQLFAQVTNPPIDPIRESLVMTLATGIGPDGNSLEETPEQCHHVSLPGPILTNGQLARLKAATGQGLFEAQTLSTLYPRSGDLGVAVDALCVAAVEAVDAGNNILVLSDRGVDADTCAIPSLLALSAVHQRLVREGIRTHTGVVVEAADVREVHHAACLIGFGAAAVNPWLALDTLRDLAARGVVVADGEHQARYLKAMHDGLLKVMSKMGISTLQSYRGAQIFEAVGLDRDLVARHFTGTPCRIGGVTLATLHDENVARHDRGFRAPPAPPALAQLLPTGGLYAFRKDGETHRWSPEVVHALQKAARAGHDDALWERYRGLADADDATPTVLRGLLRLRSEDCTPVPLDEVEDVDSIVRRFSSGAMSLGALSPEAHEMLAIAMNRLGARSNSGEGGEEEHRDDVDTDDDPRAGTVRGDARRSAIRQVASGRFGVTTHYLAGAIELQVKMAQGAKPGEGGQLPGNKVDERIARVRHATPGVSLISPPPHHDIYSIEDLKQLIWDLQSVNPTARVSVKLVAEVGVGTVAAGVVKAGAGGVTISGFEGGTGAAPLSSLKHAGLPWELGIAEAQQVLVQMGLRTRVRLQVDGGLRTGRDVVIAALLGAEEMGLATSALIAGGCVMMRKCHLNTCGVGVATQDPALRRKFPGRPEHVVAYFRWVAADVRRIMATLGVRRFDDLVGRVELLARRADLGSAKIRALDLGPVLAPPTAAPGPERRGGDARVDVGGHLDHVLVERARPMLAADPPGRVVIESTVANTDRAVGTLLSGVVARQMGRRALPDGSIDVRLHGAAGQSLGAFLAAGITLTLRGEANDGVAKGLAGGRVVVAPPPDFTLPREENVLVGNVALYGATSGELFVSGVAGERFAVRNSGARAVVEGVGDHGCEYMTGGVVVVLGAVGRNFAAGMSGGLAFVLDRNRTFGRRCNPDGLELHPLDDGDAWLVQGLVERHVQLTGSPLGARVLAAWEILRPQFVKVLPVEYKKALERRRELARAAAVASAAQ
jgi:glutamate synthase (NADPH/NADH) large chain